MDSQIEQQKAMLKRASMFEFNLLSNNDIEICNYVEKHLFYTPTPLFQGRKITQLELFAESLLHFKTFSQENFNRLYNLIKNAEIIKDQESHNAMVEISYLAHELVENIIKQDSGKVKRYHIPISISPTAIYSLGHEHCHALKDTNFKEHKDCLTLGETIPMFYELFSLNTNNKYAKKSLQTRLHYLWEDKNDYSSLYKTYFQNPISTAFTQDYQGKNINDLDLSQSGVYLNSFYYAIILYHLYKETPNKILSLIGNVLSQDITTYELLTKLDIYGNVQGEIFEQELHSLKKVLRK